MELKNYVAQWAGEVLPGATCYLYQAGTETLASGLQDAAGAALANPFQASSEGLIQFAAPNGEYDLRVMSGGRDSRMRVQCLDVAAQLAAAQGEADRAAGQADRAVSEADRAWSEAGRAEAARDSAMAAGNVYVDTDSGLAATTDGQYFSVPSASDAEYLALYRNTTGAAVDTGKRYPSVAGVNSKISPILAMINDDVDAPDDLYQFVDAEGRIVMRVEKDGGVHGNFVLPDSSLETVAYLRKLLDESINIPDALFQWADKNDRLLMKINSDGTISGNFVSPEMSAARGTTGSLNARLNSAIRADGLTTDPLYGAHYLRETHRLIAAMRSGEDGTEELPSVLSIAAIGDSWTDNRVHWTERVTRQLKRDFGNAGPGWAGIIRGAADSNIVTNTGGSWATTSYTSPSLNLTEVTNSVAGAFARVYAVADDPVTKCILHAAAGGVIKYRYNDESFIELDLAGSGSGTQVIELSAPPAGAFTLRMEVVSGTVTLYGVELRNDATIGVRVHKLGIGGSRSDQWAGVDAGRWKTGLTAINPNLITIMLAANDAFYYNAAAYAGYLQTIITRCREAAPRADILVMSQPDILNVSNYPIPDFAYIARTVAAANRCAHLDLQHHFGELPVLPNYGDDGSCYITTADPAHPTYAGGCVMSEAIYRTIVSN